MKAPSPLSSAQFLGLIFKAHPWHGVSIGSDAPALVTSYIEIVPTDTAAIPGEQKREGGAGSWAGEFLRLSGCRVEQARVHCAYAPATDVNV